MLVWAACTGTNCALWVQPCGALLGRNIDREDEGQELSALDTKSCPGEKLCEQGE